MAQALRVVCDVCGEPATETISFKVRGRKETREKDLCAKHLAEVEQDSRRASRGRPRTKDTSAAKKTAPRKRTGKPRIDRMKDGEGAAPGGPVA